ncbi:MAG: Na+/H+ antiporter subunit E [Pseudomonadota bacterium]
MKQDPQVRAGRWFTHPLLSVLLAAVWLLLQQSVTLPQLIAAALIGLAVPRLVRGFLRPATAPRPQRSALRVVGAAVRLVVVVLWDIVAANLTVARIVLWPGSRPRPAWVRVPLSVEDPLAIVLLAAIITTTPGTVSCVVDEAGREILVHALDCDDAAAMAAQIKARYEEPLQEVFG